MTKEQIQEIALREYPIKKCWIGDNATGRERDLHEQDRAVFIKGMEKALSISLVMPRSLTAKNGAKALLIGEFFEEHECSYCDADGEWVEHIEKVTVRWHTIKEIYKKIVAHYGA